MTSNKPGKRWGRQDLIILIAVIIIAVIMGAICGKLILDAII